jgi:predicted Fe-S protein YdhL (DUF1289 family)
MAAVATLQSSPSAGGANVHLATPFAFRVAIFILHITSARPPMTDVESPCNNVCAVEPISALCIGCGRNLAEIEGWMRMAADERVRIMAQPPRRLAALSRPHTERAGVG